MISVVDAHISKSESLCRGDAWPSSLHPQTLLVRSS